MEERSLEIGEVLRGEEGDDGDRKTGGCSMLPGPTQQC